MKIPFTKPNKKPKILFSILPITNSKTVLKKFIIIIEIVEIKIKIIT